MITDTHQMVKMDEILETTKRIEQLLEDPPMPRGNKIQRFADEQQAQEDFFLWAADHDDAQFRLIMQTLRAVANHGPFPFDDLKALADYCERTKKETAS